MRENHGYELRGQPGPKIPHNESPNMSNKPIYKDLVKRVATLEKEIEMLRGELKVLKEAFLDFKNQFE